ncbi:MAG: hypothetical protein PW999_09705 [Paraburkholderia tropica]|nr:hypothetical protein [Paraburkholderia tropica]
MTHEDIMATASHYSEVDHQGYVKFAEDDLINFANAILSRSDRFPEISEGERLREAWNEARATTPHPVACAACDVGVCSAHREQDRGSSPHPVAGSAGQAPEGWKLVPTQLTERMIDEADFAMQSHVGDDYSESDAFDGWFKPVWAAMLAAAPDSKAEVEGAKQLPLARIYDIWFESEGSISTFTERLLGTAPSLATSAGAVNLKAPDGEDPMKYGDRSLEASIKRLTEAYCVQQAAPIPDQMALVWRFDIGRLRNDWFRLNAWQESVKGSEQRVSDAARDAEDKQ